MTKTVELMLDSGAYGAWSRQQTIDLKAYIEFVKKLEGRLHSYIMLDVIPGVFGRRTLADVETAAEQSYKNYKAMRKSGLHPVPVYHQGDAWKWLVHYVQEADGYVCIAPAKDKSVSDRLRWCDEVFSLLTADSGFPLLKLHGLGVSDPRSLLRYPWYSVDSTAWALGPGYGNIPIPVWVGGKFDYSRRPVIVNITAVRDVGTRYEAMGPMLQERVTRYLEQEVHCSLSQARYGTTYRRQTWLTYFAGVMQARHGLQFKQRRNLHVMDAFPKARQQKELRDLRLIMFFATHMHEHEWSYTMTRMGANTRLISYFDVKDHLENVIRYIETGSITEYTGQKQPAQNWSETYSIYRRLKLLGRMSREEGTDANEVAASAAE